MSEIEEASRAMGEILISTKTIHTKPKEWKVYSSDELTNKLVHFLVYYKKLGSQTAWRLAFKNVDPQVRMKVHRRNVKDIKLKLGYTKKLQRLLKKYINDDEMNELLTEAVKQYIEQKTKTETHIHITHPEFY